jgi:hypothetical protein
VILRSRKRDSLMSSGAFRKVMLHLLLFLFLWALLVFLVIPMDGQGPASPEGRALVEGERAYAAIIRERRPNLIATLRGLNMVHAEYTQAQEGEQRLVRVGNVKLFFDLQGNFRSLELLYEPSQ